MKTVEVGDRIEHTLPHLNKTREGKVILILGTQFVYEYGKEKHTAFCMFRGDIWKKLK
tara:strand:+ start:69 stop:242 length:174 start_codon:yes stop_codon:yes gene_type:complete